MTEGYGGKYLARGGKQKLEGDPFIGNRTVIVEFASEHWNGITKRVQSVSEAPPGGSYGTLVVVEGVKIDLDLL